MKNSVKIALGVVAGGVLVFLNHKRKNRANKNQIFTAPDGNKYKENQMYCTAEGDVYKNGRKLRLETPENNVPVQNHVEPGFNDQHLNNNNNASQQVSYHQKGTRHH